MNRTCLIQSHYMETPLGLLEIRAREEGVSAVTFVEQPEREHEETELLILASAQLKQYFHGARKTFTFPLAPEGTPFQQKVWHALQRVGYGETASYRDIASSIQAPAAVRAVGAANGRNPIAIVVPCHRIIGASGHLTGYAGGLKRKAWLLQLEQSQLSLI